MSDSLRESSGVFRPRSLLFQISMNQNRPKNRKFSKNKIPVKEIVVALFTIEIAWNGILKEKPLKIITMRWKIEMLRIAGRARN